MDIKQGIYYLVNTELLPDAIRDTARAKELIAGGKLTQKEALKAVGISRSTYYKYKDGVFSFYSQGDHATMELDLSLEHSAGVLSRVLNEIAEAGGNVLTIHQELPTAEGAEVTLRISTLNARQSPAEIADRLTYLRGVLSVRPGSIRL